MFDKHDLELYVLGRAEFEWFPKVEANTKYYKIGTAKNFYYLKNVVYFYGDLY